MPEGDGYDKLRDLRRKEVAQAAALDLTRESISKEVRALYNGVYGRPKSLQEIADAVGVSKTTAHAWARRGAGKPSVPRSGGGE